MIEDYAVALVVDPGFGVRLPELAMRFPVWIVDTAANRPVAEQCWHEPLENSNRESVTTFTVDPSGMREEWCIGVLPAIDLHHGEYSRHPPYGAVEVYGLALTARLAEAFAEYGMTDITVTAEGFRAAKPKSNV